MIQLIDLLSRFIKIFIDYAVCLRVNSIDASANGTTLCLKCQYSMDPNENLSGIQWYRNDNPFYYYTRGASKGDKPLDLYYSTDTFEVNVSNIIQFYYVIPSNNNFENIENNCFVAATIKR